MMRVIGHRPPWFMSLSITKLSIAMMTMINGTTNENLQREEKGNPKLS
jgi:hypothetical protein